MPPASDVERDRWGRPLIIPPEGGKPVAYTRMSTIAKVLDDQSNLIAWAQRMTAIGLLKRPALMTRLSGIVATGELDSDDSKKASKAKRDLTKLCKEAQEAAGSLDRASAGTGLHALTEALDAGLPLEFVSAPDLARVKEYEAAMAEYTPLRAEGFVVQDDIKAAGSYDRLWLCPDGRVRVGDLKTGAWDKKYPMGVTTQLAGYANGLHYDYETGAREPLHPDLDPSIGLLISMPPSGGCEVVPLDLTLGWRCLTAAIETRALRKLGAEDFYANLA